jgi:hypothetical protein
MLVDHILDLLVDPGRVRQQLIEAEPSHHVAHGCLADLVDGVVDVLDRDHRALRIGDVIIGHRGDTDRDVVLGDDLLRRNLHGNGTQRRTHHLLEGHENQREPRPAYAGKFAEQKHHPALVLLENAKRPENVNDGDGNDNGNPTHGGSPLKYQIAQRRCIATTIRRLNRNISSSQAPPPTTAHYHHVIGRHVTNGTERRRDEMGKDRRCDDVARPRRLCRLLDKAPASTRRAKADRRSACRRVNHRWWLPKKFIGGVRRCGPTRDIIRHREAHDG